VKGADEARHNFIIKYLVCCHKLPRGRPLFFPQVKHPSFRVILAVVKKHLGIKILDLKKALKKVYSESGGF
jgi:hypothetical protein